MKRFDCWCDMGSMKIMFKGGCCYFDNEVGDIDFKVCIIENKKDEEIIKNNNFEFKGHFTVLDKAYLMAYDCTINKKCSLHEFNKGRYFVELDTKKTIFYIYLKDEDIHA